MYQDRETHLVAVSQFKLEVGQIKPARGNRSHCQKDLAGLSIPGRRGQ
jgi:hypothetical protein